MSDDILKNINSENTLPAGAKFIDPKAIISQLDIKEGMMVADFGCGTGYFSLPLARKVGADGLVYSLDILPQKLEVVESQAKTQNINNIVTRRVNLELVGGSKLESSSVDWVVIKDMLFQNKEKSFILEECKRILKKGGKAVVIEWNNSKSLLGPKSSLRISKERLGEIAMDAGLIVMDEVAAGDFNYGLILAK